MLRIPKLIILCALFTHAPGVFADSGLPHGRTHRRGDRYNPSEYFSMKNLLTLGEASWSQGPRAINTATLVGAPPRYEATVVCEQEGTAKDTNCPVSDPRCGRAAAGSRGKLSGTSGNNAQLAQQLLTRVADNCRKVTKRKGDTASFSPELGLNWADPADASGTGAGSQSGLSLSPQDVKKRVGATIGINGAF